MNLSNAHSPNGQQHCQCCRYNIHCDRTSTRIDPPFPALSNNTRQHNIFQQPLQPQTTWSYPNGTLQWTPNTFTGANSSIPLPGAELWTRSAVPGANCNPSGIQLNPILWNGSMVWNVSRSPTKATQQGSRAALAALLPGTALQPDFRKVTIDVGTETNLSQWAFVWGRLRVEAGSPLGITVKNVMDAIYTYFHTPLSSAELGMVHQDDHAMLMRTRTARVNSSGGQHRLVDPGPLRIDLMLACHYFECLSVVSFRGTHCKLSLRLKYANN